MTSSRVMIPEESLSSSDIKLSDTGNVILGVDLKDSEDELQETGTIPIIKEDFERHRNANTLKTKQFRTTGNMQRLFPCERSVLRCSGNGGKR